MLDITIGTSDSFAAYLLRGEIRWVEEDDDDYFMGILLIDEERMDLVKGVENFDKTVAA